MIGTVVNLHNKVFAWIESATNKWLLGLFARFTFAAVLFVYFINSASLKVSKGFLGFFQVQDAAYFQILPKAVETFNYDVSQIPFLYDLVVYFGTYSEFLLPTLIVIGLFTRLAALGMIGFIFVQSYVDVMFHNLDEASIGSWFDRLSDAVIIDQRALWVFLLLILVLKGAGKISLDAVLGKIWQSRNS